MNILLPATQARVEENLIQHGLITKDRIEALKQQAQAKNTPFFSLLLSAGHITDEQLTRALADANNTPYVNLANARINAKVLELLPKDIAERYMAVPLGEMQAKLVVAMLDAGNVQAVDFLSNKIARPLKVYAASESGIRQILKQYDKNIERGVSNLLAGTEVTSDENSGTESVTQGDKKVQVIVEDSPISKALSAIMDYAAKNRASDIHIEPQEKELKIRVRVDGVLREIMKLPKSTEAPLVSRIKILSDLKIDEHRIPQDGQFTVKADNKPIDLRVAISPTVWGEQIVIRLLDKTGSSFQLEAMGYTGRALRLLRKGLQRPYGMILTSGPTGSGKSTSMYAMIQEIKTDNINIVTLEDPVEYKSSFEVLLDI